MLRLLFAMLLLPLSWTLVFAEPNCSLSGSQIFAQAAPSIVRVFALSIDPFKPRDPASFATGTGFVISTDGTTVTNYHVILQSKEMSLTFNDGRRRPGMVVAGDPILDIAILRPVPHPDQEPETYTPIELAAEDIAQIGQKVFAIGYPLGLKLSISSGIVSSTSVVLPLSTLSWDAPFIQTDAAINPGNSGGPLLDECGKVVGMNSLSIPRAQSMGFAIPAGRLRRTIAELLENGRIIRPWIGISGQMCNDILMMVFDMPCMGGFMVETIEPGSGAESAGLKGGRLPVQFGPASYLLGGDVIEEVNGTPMSNVDDVVKMVRSIKPGQKVKITYIRPDEYEDKTVEVVVPERPILPQDLSALADKAAMQ